MEMERTETSAREGGALYYRRGEIYSLPVCNPLETNFNEIFRSDTAMNQAEETGENTDAN